ncbi:hypothetical protein CRG98_024649 [Punica granatum]|uniref:Uncharacterized protein n=1 Tax=Punica granatum TaxID=22663 RepID=A0A2I0JFF6_PUNGR|nr:hypothetical protein CRG98_024649 [Punica granatum]
MPSLQRVQTSPSALEPLTLGWLAEPPAGAISLQAPLRFSAGSARAPRRPQNPLYPSLSLTLPLALSFLALSLRSAENRREIASTIILHSSFSSLFSPSAEPLAIFPKLVCHHWLHDIIVRCSRLLFVAAPGLFLGILEPWG